MSLSSFATVPVTQPLHRSGKTAEATAKATTHPLGWSLKTIEEGTLPDFPDLTKIPASKLPKAPILTSSLHLLTDVNTSTAHAIIGAFNLYAANVRERYNLPANEKIPTAIAEKYPLRLTLQSPGGNVHAGEAILRALDNLRDKQGFIIETYVNDACSMAADLAMAGSEGHRFLAKDGQLMLHQAGRFVFQERQSTHLSKQQAELLDKIEKRRSAYTVERSAGRLTLETLNEKIGTGQDWYVTPEEARDLLGFTIDTSFDYTQDANDELTLSRYKKALALLMGTVGKQKGLEDSTPLTDDDEGTEGATEMKASALTALSPTNAVQHFQRKALNAMA